jgi:hypothetical protein
MATLDLTRALIADLAKTIGLTELPQDESGGWHLSVGGTDDVYIYGGNDITFLVVMPIGPLPTRPSFALVNYLLRGNLFDSEYSPFQIATDENATLVQWGRLAVAEFDGAKLAKAIDNLTDRAIEIRKELGDTIA